MKIYIYIVKELRIDHKREAKKKKKKKKKTKTPHTHATKIYISNYCAVDYRPQ